MMTETLTLKTLTKEEEKVHPWRICPIGQHYVRTHPLHTRPGEKHPQGEIVTRHGHCADNPSHKDMLSYDEIQAMAQAHFSDLVEPIKSGSVIDFPKADIFDQYIRGWVRYWNEVLEAEELLDANLVKALIAGESSFEPQKRIWAGNKKRGYARGLMQITDETLSIVGGHKGEVKDHFICATHHEVMDPSTNICIGVRWLFTKKIDAKARLHHAATWDDAVAEYKGILEAVKHGKDPRNEMAIFRSFYQQLLESSK